MKKQTTLKMVFVCALFLSACTKKTSVSSVIEPEETPTPEVPQHDEIDEKMLEYMSEEEVKEYRSYSYFDIDKLDRYLACEADSIRDKIITVNMDHDKKPYEDMNIVSDDDYDLIANKHNALKEGYQPEDLVPVVNACKIGVHYSCQDVPVIEIREEVNNAFAKWAEAMKEEGLELTVIAGFRSYEYQNWLWTYYANANGQEYADSYYARPGTSEHNTGLALDITFNNHPFNEIELQEGYDKLLESAHEYGFILRYPEDKKEETQYNYESWHFRYVGEELAKELYENDMTLEYYYATR